MELSLLPALTLAMTVIGFIMVWFRIGSSQGKQEKTLETLADRVKKNEGDIEDLKRAVLDIRVEIARSFAKIEAALECIKKTVDDFKPKGGRRAEKK